jgi:arylsulfatase A-like enzyme
MLTGAASRLNRDSLYWRFGVQYAVRQGDWKLVKAGLDLDPMLVNLADDPGEQVDLSEKEPAKAAALQKLWDRWNATMQPPRWQDRRWNGDENRKANRVKKKPAKQAKPAAA